MCGRESCGGIDGRWWKTAVMGERRRKRWCGKGEKGKWLELGRKNTSLIQECHTPAREFKERMKEDSRNVQNYP